MEQSASHIAGDPRADSSPCSHSAAEIPCLAPQGTRPPRETQGQSQGLAAGWLSSLAAGHTIPARAPLSPVLPVHGQAREQMGRRPSSLAEGAPGPTGPTGLGRGRELRSKRSRTRPRAIPRCSSSRHTASSICQTASRPPRAPTSPRISRMWKRLG